MTSQRSIAAIVLAAGGSTRLGRPKQLLAFRGQPLVRRATMAALDAGCGPVVVVVGSSAAPVTAALDGLAVSVVHNAAWASGMGSSLRLGATAVLAAGPGVEGAVVVLCDQPHLSADVLDRLISEWTASARPMAASAYGGTFGPPCCFSREVLQHRFAGIPDDAGAKAVLASDLDAVLHVAWPDGLVDVDTREQWEAIAERDVSTR